MELAVAMLISLFVTLAIVKVVFDAEKQKRVTTTGSDAQSNGAMALVQLRQAVMPAGYGYTQAPAAIGCNLVAAYKGAPIAGFPATLAPLTIADGGMSSDVPAGTPKAAKPDSIRVLGSAKSTYSIPIRIADVYAPPQTELKVAFTVGVQPPGAGYPGDLVLAVSDSTQPCELFHVTGLAGATSILRADEEDGWNAHGHPSRTYVDGDVLVNLGLFTDASFTIEKNALAVRRFRLSAAGAPSYEGPSELQANIVNLQAFYGKDQDGDGSIDRWDTAVPASNAEWLQVTAVRVAVVARTAQYEKESVTQANPLWDVGASVTVLADTVDCGASKCLPLQVNHLPDWMHYRYKVFDTTIPLPNLLWRPA